MGGTREPTKNRTGKAATSYNFPAQSLTVTLNHAVDDNAQQANIIPEKPVAFSRFCVRIRGTGFSMIVETQFVDTIIHTATGTSGVHSSFDHWYRSC
jgi:hypothetical protein